MSFSRVVNSCLRVLPAGSAFSYRVLLTTPRRFAGHAHWQNVKHTKEANDKIKAKTAQYYSRAVMKAVKAGGGSKDPKLNGYLAAVLAEAKANSVPSATLQKVLKAENTTDPYVIEVQAQGGLFVLVESCAYPINPEKQRLASLVKKYGCSVAPAAGRIAKEFFDRVGLVTVASGPNCPIQEIDSATNIGIEVGASDVDECVTDGQAVFRFHCSPTEVEDIRRRLRDDHGIDALSADDAYLPKSLVSVQPEVWKNLNEMYSRIRDQHEYVDRIFDNVNVLDSSK